MEQQVGALGNDPPLVAKRHPRAPLRRPPPPPSSPHARVRARRCARRRRSPGRCPFACSMTCRTARRLCRRPARPSSCRPVPLSALWVAEFARAVMAAPGCRRRACAPSLRQWNARRNGRWRPPAPPSRGRRGCPRPRWSSVPTPPEAMTGIVTASATARVSSRSKPVRVPSRSIEVSKNLAGARVRHASGPLRWRRFPLACARHG